MWLTDWREDREHYKIFSYDCGNDEDRFLTKIVCDECEEKYRNLLTDQASKVNTVINSFFGE